MRKNKNFKENVKKPKGKVLPTMTQKEYEEELLSRKFLREQTEYLGIQTIFDSDFLTEDMEKQYEKDSSYALALLLSGKEVPKDVQDRLLRIKKLREQFKYNNDK